MLSPASIPLASQCHTPRCTHKQHSHTNMRTGSKSNSRISNFPPPKYLIGSVRHIIVMCYGQFARFMDDMADFHERVPLSGGWHHHFIGMVRWRSDRHSGSHIPQSSLEQNLHLCRCALCIVHIFFVVVIQMFHRMCLLIPFTFSFA